MPLSSKQLNFGAAAVAAVSLALAIAAPGDAQQATQNPGQKPGAPDPSRVTAGAYTADIHHTMVRWEVDHLGLTPYFGIFGDVTGTLALDPKNLSAAKVDITIPVSKITTASPGLTEHLFKPSAEPGAKPDFFGPSPADARFVSTSVTVSKDDPTEAKVTGNLTLNGVTKPVTLDVEFYGAGTMPPAMGGKENVGFKAEATIRRSDFGIDGFIPLVSDEVKLDIVAAFMK